MEERTNGREKKSETAISVFFKLIFSIVFIALLIVAPVFFILTPDKEQSELENRVLAQFPVPTISSVTDGSFMRDFETYLADQFPMRDTVVSSKSYIDRITGKKEINNVFIGKEGYLFEMPSKVDVEQLDKITHAIKTFADKYERINTAVAIAPNATYVLGDKLPSGVEFESQADQLLKIKSMIDSEHYTWIDCLSPIERIKDSTQVYYRTDHHWTTRGAYSAFEAIASAWNFDTSKAGYKFFCVSDSFQGTLASSSGLNDITDIVEICVPYKSGEGCIVEYESQHLKTATLFDKNKLLQKNHYEVFMGGNFDKIVISTDVDTTNALLIVKDSYANCMIPMFTPYFSKIIVIDPRYFNDNINGIMQDYDLSHMLFLYNVDTFLEDNSLADVLE